MGNAKVPIALTGLAAAGFLFRAIPHLFLVPRWIVEEAYNYVTVRDLVLSGASAQAGFYPMLEHQLIYAAWLITRIDPVVLSQYANPLLGALTVVPLFYVLRHKLTVNQSLLGCGLWAFSEAAFYRAAYFGSTEALGFLLSLSALAFYQRKYYIAAAPLLILGALSHLLPTAFISGVAAVDLLLKATTKQKVLIIAAGIGVLAIFFSPLNPHQRLLSSISVDAVVGGFGTFGIYSVSEVLSGVAMFSGFIALCAVAAWGWLNARHNRLMTIYLALAAAVFVFSWVDYQPNIFAPPRLTFYFLVPGIFYAAKLGSAKVIAAIMVLSVIAAGVGTPTMLLTEHTMEAEEYVALEEIAALGIIGDYSWWLADYPVTVNLSVYASDPSLWDKEIRLDAMRDRVESIHNAIASSSFVYPFQYIYLSERMMRGGFFMEQTGGRTAQVVSPVADIWRGDPANWALVYEGHGVRVYHYEGKVIPPVS